MWKAFVGIAENAAAVGEYRIAIGRINDIVVAGLPRVGPLPDLPYHVLSDLLCKLDQTNGEWHIDKISPALLKWLANQGSDTCGGVPYIGRHIPKFATSNPDKFAAYRAAIERAVDLFGCDGWVTTSEATVICQSSDEGAKDRIYAVLDNIFGDLTYDQCNHIFAMWNGVPIAWFRERKDDLLAAGGSATTMLNLTRLMAAYGSTEEIDRAALATDTSRSYDKAIQARARIRDARARAGMFRMSPDRPLNVALCVSGQLRGYRTAKESWSRLGLDGHQIKTFVHVWSGIGRKWPHPHHAQRSFPYDFAKAFSEYAVTYGDEFFWDRYPGVKSLFATDERADEEELRKFYDADAVLVEDEGTAAFNFSSNTERLHYKVAKCHDLMKSSGEAFDLVVRIRPDKQLIGDGMLDLRRLLEVSSTERAVFLDHTEFFLPPGGLGFGDQIGIGTVEVMDVYASVWSNYLRRRDGGSYPWEMIGRDLLLHTDLAHDCLAEGIVPKNIRDVAQIVGEPLDPEAVGIDALREAVQSGVPEALNAHDRKILEAVGL